jgi:hypothetical protein
MLCHGGIVRPENRTQLWLSKRSPYTAQFTTQQNVTCSYGNVSSKQKYI